MLPDWLKKGLRRKENGRDIIGITISLSTVQRVVKMVKQLLTQRRGKKGD